MNPGDPEAHADAWDSLRRDPPPTDPVPIVPPELQQEQEAKQRQVELHESLLRLTPTQGILLPTGTVREPCPPPPSKMKRTCKHTKHHSSHGEGGDDDEGDTGEYQLDMDDKIRNFLTYGDHMRKMQERNPSAPIVECSIPRYHRCLRYVWGLLTLLMVLTFVPVYLITKAMDMKAYADDHIWIYVTLGLALSFVGCIYCTMASSEWSSKMQIMLLIAFLFITIFSLSVMTTATKAMFILHSMVVVVGVFFTFFLFTFQRWIKFTIFGALIYCAVVTFLIIMLFVYLPERNHVYSLYGWQYISEESWHIVVATLTGMMYIVYTLLLLYKQIQERKCWDFLYITFYLYFNIGFVLILLKNIVERMQLKDVQTARREHNAFGLQGAHGPE